MCSSASNGETLDALQELTRLAVLRQSKRRARLLLDINGFRARQREQLVSIVKATAEQVIRTREDHEFQPIDPGRTQDRPRRRRRDRWCPDREPW